MLRILAGIVLLAVSPVASAGAQTAPATAPAPDPDPARLAAAQALMQRIMPADKRDAMIEAMLRPMFENMRGAMFDGPQFEAAKAGNPKLAARVDTFLKGEFEHSIAALKTAMPAMIEAMARAYARRFTLDQLQAIDTFFQTPAGRAYVELAPTVMADPDLLAVQRTMMTDTVNRMQERMKTLATQIEEDD